MKFFSTDRGIAREAADGGLEILDLAARDLGEQLVADPTLAQAKHASVLERVSLVDVNLLAPIPRPGKVIGIGINYQSHVEETRESLAQAGIKVPDFPVFFVVPGTAVTGPNSPIILPEVAPAMVDYEIEFTAVIGSGGFGISRSNATSHVAGYTLAIAELASTLLCGPPKENRVERLA